MSYPADHLDTVIDYEDSNRLKEAVSKVGLCGSTFCIDQNIDELTSFPQNLEHELKRLETLKSYRILDSAKEQSFERITGLASRILNVPICLVSLVDLGRQWFMSNRGLGDVRETPRSAAFCAHAVHSKLDLLIVPDATKDDRFSKNPLVTGDPNIRFYAGAPLTCPEGFRLGTLCIIDTKPWPNGMSLSQKQNLMDFSGLIMDTMVVRKKKYEQLSKDRWDTVACTAHDLLTPLTCIQLNLSLLAEDENLVMNKEQRDLVTSSNDCAELVGKLCRRSLKDFQSALDMSDKKSSPATGNNGSVMVSRLVEGLRDVVKSYPKMVPLSINISDDVPTFIVSHDLSIFRSALNLLTNACKVTKAGFIILNIFVKKADNQCEKEGNKSEDMLVFECEDTGPGVPESSYSDLFKPFGAKVESDGSMGLGLYSVSRHIGGLNGTYGYRKRTQEGQKKNSNVPTQSSGSVFWFQIPIIEPHKTTEYPAAEMEVELENDLKASANFNRVQMGVDSASCVSEEEDSERATDLKREMDMAKKRGVSLERPPKQRRPNKEPTKTALVIDDSITIRKSIGRALTRLGFDVQQAEDGLQGLNALKDKVFHVVFCDFLMPVMDGLDCVQQYREWECNHRPWVKQFIVGMSAHAHSLDADRGLKMGMCKFLMKPLPLKTLKEIAAFDEIKVIDEKIKSHSVQEKERCVENNFDSMNLKPAEHGQDLFCLIAEASISISESMAKCVELNGWRPCIVNNGADALDKLKARNWDAVFVDEKLPRLSGTTCVSHFRSWEGTNRIARQNNMFLISESCAPNNETIPPKEFDGVMGTPIDQSKLVNLLDSVQKEFVFA